MQRSKMARPAPRPARMVPASATAASRVLGELVPGGRVVGLSWGEFSMLDLIRGALDQIGPAAVTIATWNMESRDVATLARLRDCGLITSLVVLIDRSFTRLHPAPAAAAARLLPGCVRESTTHAKFAVLRNEGWNVTIRSSANMNRNRRLEQFDLDDDADIADLFVDAVARVPAPRSGATTSPAGDLDHLLREIP